jgi:transposase
MPPATSPSDRLRELFRRRPCWTRKQLSQALGRSPSSVGRFLKQAGYFHSYTHNARWYTLREIPQFDRDGLWWHQDIGFSRQRNLIATIEHLLARSPAGLSANELSAKLRHPCHAVLPLLYRTGRLTRVKAAGEFRYLATSTQIQQQQRAQIEAQTPVPPPPALSAQVGMWVLVELIQHPEWSLEQIAGQLRRCRQMSVSVESLRRFLEEHGVKKTAEPSTAKSWKPSVGR